MKRFGMYLTVLLLIAVASAAIPIGGKTASADDSYQTFITWKVIGGSAPTDFQGKIIPVQGSKIEASVSVLQNGKFVPLNSTDVNWYLDGDFISGGAGMQTMAFNAPGNDETMQLRVEIPGIGNGIIYTDYIPMIDPEVVLVAPFPENIFYGRTLTLTAVPYYFNTSDFNQLSYGWTVNSEAMTPDTPNVLSLGFATDTPQGYELSIMLAVGDNSNPLVSLTPQFINLTSGNQ